MSVITFPDNLGVRILSWSQVRLDVSFSSPFGSQAAEVSSPLWAVTLESVPMYESQAGAWQSLLLRLRGQTNQLALWNMGRPEPRGTMRGTLTLNTAAAQGDTSLSIVDATQGGKTLLAGDLLGIGTATTQQVVMVMEDATADGGGVIAITIEPPLRNSFSAGAGVEWDRPKALFRRKQSIAGWDYQNILINGFTLELVEDTRT